jgi:hypothetical protein
MQSSKNRDSSGLTVKFTLRIGINTKGIIMENQNTENNLHQIKFELFLDALADGAARSRTILTFLFVGSFIAFVALINSFQGELSWFKSRLDSHREASKWIVFPDELDPMVPQKIRFPSDTTMRSNAFEPVEFFALMERFIPNLGKMEGLQSAKDTILHLRPTFLFRFPANSIDLSTSTFVPDRILKENYIDVLMGLATMNYPSKRDFDNILLQLERTNVEHRLMVSIPIIGLSIDVNNLCWATAIAFSIFYFMLMFSLSRERKNLVLTFLVGFRKNYRLSTIFQLLSMRQIFTIPSSIDENLKEGRSDLDVPPLRKNMFKIGKLSQSHFGRFWVPKAPLIFPALVWIAIFVYDRYSNGIGSSLNGKLNFTNTIFSIITAIPMFYLCIKCFVNWRKIDDVWQFYAEKIKKDYAESGIGARIQPYFERAAHLYEGALAQEGTPLIRRDYARLLRCWAEVYRSDGHEEKAKELEAKADRVLQKE